MLIWDIFTITDRSEFEQFICVDGAQVLKEIERVVRVKKMMEEAARPF